LPWLSAVNPWAAPVIPIPGLIFVPTAKLREIPAVLLPRAPV
jgi:hypothetical protein